MWVGCHTTWRSTSETNSMAQAMPPTANCWAGLGGISWFRSSMSGLMAKGGTAGFR